MISRRKFIKVLGIFGLGITFLPHLFTKRPYSKIKYFTYANVDRFWLLGLPKRGCAASHLLSEQNSSFENCLWDLHSLSDLS